MAGSEQLPKTVGRYQIFGEIASGGMATVHYGRLAGPVGFSRTVAIKKLHPQFAKDPDFVTMFLDEARLCGRIRHPNVVPTLDVVSVDGEIFIVMEYVAGEALSKLLKTAWTHNVPMPPKIAATIVSSILHGLHSAHVTKDEHGRELGIVHRDVSPQNVLVGADGVARVLDFGVAKARGRLQTTRDGQVKGKIAYMPPEQLSGGLVSRQTDIYAAGVVLWEALTSRRLFDGETEALTLVRAIEGRIDPPSSYNPELGSLVDGVVLRGLARDPEERFATAREMALAIEQSIGLASPSEVGEWVEHVGSEELAKRAARIAEIEQASLQGQSDPRIGLAPQPAEPPHSQVSSISVSRPAVSIAPATRRGSRIFLAIALTLGLTGLGLGGYALQEGVLLGGAPPPGEPNDFGHDVVPLSMLGPPSAPAKAGAKPAPDPSASASTQPQVKFGGKTQTQTQQTARPPNPCDPPYTIDPATGRKKYKLECMK
jgi:serine/threonine-protein kinase